MTIRKQQFNFMNLNKTEKRFVIEGTVKALLSFIPMVGGAIGSILNDALQDEKEQKMLELIESLSFELALHKNKINTSFVSNVEFLDLFEKTSRRVIDERIEAKRIAYKNIILHGILSDDSSYYELEEQIRILDQIYADHLELLHFFYSPETYLSKKNMPLIGGYTGSTYGSFLKQTFPSFDLEKLTDLFFDLENLRLIMKMSDELQTMFMNVSYNSFNNKLTKRGKLFVEYILKN